MSFAMKTTSGAEDWDQGDGSFVHSLHRFIWQNVNVFPMFFVTNAVLMKSIWYMVDKETQPCKCVAKMVPLAGPLPSKKAPNEGGYNDRPLSKAEFSLYTEKMEEKYEQRFAKMEAIVGNLQKVIERQDRIIEKFTLLADYGVIKVPPAPAPTPGPSHVQGPVHGRPDREREMTKKRKIVLVANPLPATPLSSVAEQPEYEVRENIVPTIAEEGAPVILSPRQTVPEDFPVEEAPVKPSSGPGVVNPDVPVAGPSQVEGWRAFAFKQPTKCPTDPKRSYTPEEDRVILQWAKDHPINTHGKMIWKELEKSGLVPGRTFESLRTRYTRQLAK